MVALTPVTLDLTLLNEYVTIYARQDDSNSRWLKCTITDRGTKVAVPQTASVRMECRRYDGEHYTADGNVLSNGEICIPLTYDMLAVNGEASCTAIIEEDDSVLGSIDFTVVVTHRNGGCRPPQRTGVDGVGISSIALVSTEGTVDTYQVNLTNGTAYTFDVHNGVVPAFEWDENDGYYTLHITAGESSYSFDIVPTFVDSTTVVQTSGNNPSKVMSQKAVTQLVESNKGWTSAQIDLLEDFKDFFSMMIDKLGYINESGNPGYTAAVNAVNKLTELIDSLRQADVHDFDFTVVDGTMDIDNIEGGYTLTGNTLDFDW